MLSAEDGSFLVTSCSGTQLNDWWTCSKSPADEESLRIRFPSTFVKMDSKRVLLSSAKGEGNGDLLAGIEYRLPGKFNDLVAMGTVGKVSWLHDDAEDNGEVFVGEFK